MSLIFVQHELIDIFHPIHACHSHTQGGLDAFITPISNIWTSTRQINADGSKFNLTIVSRRSRSNVYTKLLSLSKSLIPPLTLTETNSDLDPRLTLTLTFYIDGNLGNVRAPDTSNEEWTKRAQSLTLSKPNKFCAAVQLATSPRLCRYGGKYYCYCYCYYCRCCLFCL